MKKYAIIALAAVMVAAFALPAYALENEFGGFFDTRFQTKKYYDGLDRSDLGGRDDTEQNVETRTRLYYTAKINDNLKFVNKFELDTTWGANGQYGGVGADRSGDKGAIEVKNSYIDFNVGPVNLTVGAQPYYLFNGFFIDTDASGAIARWKVLDNFVLAAAWLKAFESPSTAGGDDTFPNSNENGDIDSYTLSAAFWFNENISVKPSFNWIYTADAEEGIGTFTDMFDGPPDLTGFLNDANIYTYGLDFDMAYDNFGVWATAVGQSGTLDTDIPGVGDIDFGGYLFALGGNVMVGMFDIYAEGAYASGQDEDDDADEYNEFFNPSGSRPWSELLGDGILWGGDATDQTNDNLNNLWYVGAGVKFSPMDKLTINPSIWYAELAEDNELGDDELGTEVDLVVSYQLVEGLNLQLIGAYLFAGDAFITQNAIDAGNTTGNEEDAYEYGMRLSLSF